MTALHCDDCKKTITTDSEIGWELRSFGPSGNFHWWVLCTDCAYDDEFHDAVELLFGTGQQYRDGELSEEEYAERVTEFRDKYDIPQPESNDTE